VNKPGHYTQWNKLAPERRPLHDSTYLTSRIGKFKPHAWATSYAGGWGWMITWVQEFETTWQHSETLTQKIK
jgi:hypothetical protein